MHSLAKGQSTRFDLATICLGWTLVEFFAHSSNAEGKRGCNRLSQYLGYIYIYTLVMFDVFGERKKSF